MKWKVYLSKGTKNELDEVKSNLFDTKKDATAWAKKHGYDTSSVVKETEWSEGKVTAIDIITIK